MIRSPPGNAPYGEMSASPAVWLFLHKRVSQSPIDISIVRPRATRTQTRAMTIARLRVSNLAAKRRDAGPVRGVHRTGHSSRNTGGVLGPAQ